MSEPRVKPIMFDDARILFRNFSGREGQYNREGDRNFCLILSQEEAVRLKDEGWNVKLLKPREEDDLPQPYLKVKVHFGSKNPPKVILMTSKGKHSLDAKTVSSLDWAEINRVDLTVNPWRYDVAGKTGIAAYLKAIYVTIEEDEFEMRYMDVPDIGGSSLSFEVEDEDDNV